ncbi:MAG TPA: SRPBCC family protein [Gemmatimonadaceae bacterium]|nr:SRPBCC family protein [Gemmatimonadaceae bacterium]
MAIVISERFHVQAPVERVWRYLVTPGEVVQCVPGAELTGVEDDRSFRGRVTVKVGPMMIGYTGSGRFDELDEQRHAVRLTAEGREGSGSGAARMTLASAVTETDGGADVQLDATVELSGRIVQFGRGLIDDVSRQLLRQFVGCVRTTLETAAADGAPANGAPAGDAAAAPGTPAAADASRKSGRHSRPSVDAMPLVVGALRRWLRRIFRWRRTA